MHYFDDYKGPSLKPAPSELTKPVVTETATPHHPAQVTLVNPRPVVNPETIQIIGRDAK